VRVVGQRLPDRRAGVPRGVVDQHDDPPVLIGRVHPPDVPQVGGKRLPQPPRHARPADVRQRLPPRPLSRGGRATRVKAVELLNARLADCIDLQTQTKQAHWDVKGPNFIAPHELFDKINVAVEDYVDDIAERAVQLDGVAEGTARKVAKSSSLAEYPGNAADGRGHVEAHLQAER
jgi:starvation-inducible DNA-binding protein